MGLSRAFAASALSLGVFLLPVAGPASADPGTDHGGGSGDRSDRGTCGGDFSDFVGHGRPDTPFTGIATAPDGDRTIKIIPIDPDLHLIRVETSGKAGDLRTATDTFRIKTDPSNNAYIEFEAPQGPGTGASLACDRGGTRVTTMSGTVRTVFGTANFKATRDTEPFQLGH
ncbi:hypothetical protein [Streptomyces sp. NPDC059918]|uniref:hypothetical protein n=1 Tax=unclassified Streptomyces TaxID=2593676 RepID=UPI0036481242